MERYCQDEFKTENRTQIGAPIREFWSLNRRNPCRVGPELTSVRGLFWQAVAPDIGKIERASQAKIAQKWTPYNICEACENLSSCSFFRKKTPSRKHSKKTKNRHFGGLFGQAVAPDIEQIERASQAKIAHKWTPYNICEACENLSSCSFFRKKRLLESTQKRRKIGILGAYSDRL